MALIYTLMVGSTDQVSQVHIHAGRSETEIEYSVGFDANGIISALDCKAWCLAGAFMDLAWNDLYGVMTGLDMVTSWKDNHSMCNHIFEILCTYLFDEQDLLLLESTHQCVAVRMASWIMSHRGSLPAAHIGSYLHSIRADGMDLRRMPALAKLVFPLKFALVKCRCMNCQTCIWRARCAELTLCPAASSEALASSILS